MDIETQLRETIARLEAELAALKSKPESVQCSFCLGSWPLIHEGRVAVVRGLTEEVSICETCVAGAVELVNKHHQKK